MGNTSKQYNSRAFNGLADVSPFSFVDDYIRALPYDKELLKTEIPISP